MAEVILPPTENEQETPVEKIPEVAKPIELSKVIEVTFNPLDTSNTSVKNTRQSLYTTDTDAWIFLKVDKMNNPTGTYSLVLYNREDGSVFQRKGDIVEGAAYYKLLQEEIKHAGRWLGQVVITLNNGETTASRFSFSVDGHILDGKDVRQIVIQDFQALMAQLNDLKNVAEQNELNRVEAEVAREQAELLREENYTSQVNTAIVEADVVTKVDDKVAELSPTIQKVTEQLVQTKYEKANWTDVFFKREWYQHQ